MTYGMYRKSLTYNVDKELHTSLYKVDIFYNAKMNIGALYTIY